MARFTPIVLGIALAAGFQSAPANADTGDARRADSAVAWLAGQAPSGELPAAGRADWGLVSDAVIGTTAAGATRRVVNPMAQALRAQVGSRWAVQVVNGTPQVDVGAASKAVLSASLTGDNPASYNGRNVRAEVVKQVQPTGRVGQQSNVFVQSYAVLGLSRTGTAPASTVAFLVAQQCPAGYFRLTPRTAPCTTEQPDRDATAMAVMALRGAAADGNSVADAAYRRAATWLAADQRPSGGWIASEFAATENSNTTGLAAAALSGLNQAAVDRATAFVRSLQLTSGPDTGAVAYNRDAFRAGLNDRNRGQWQRATAQAVLALRPVSLHAARAVPGPVPAVDVYTTPGNHQVNGRQWRTTCEPYSQTARCRTEIWATQVSSLNSRFVPTTGWFFNNLTYLPTMTAAQWARNPLGHTGAWTASDGRKWRTECNTPATGRDGCRSYIWADFIASSLDARGNRVYAWKSDWVFNNMVRFGR